MTPQLDLCEKCQKGQYVPDKSINTGETWFFCNNCFKYHPDDQVKIDAEAGAVGSPRSGGVVLDDGLLGEDDGWFAGMKGCSV